MAQIFNEDARRIADFLEPESVQCVVTSPPYYGLRDYGVEGQIGLEATPEEYVEKLVAVFREVRRVLRDDGTLWLNLGDSYARTGGTDRRVSDTAKVGSTRNTLVQMSDRTSKAPPGLKNKDLIGIPWRVAFALQADGWYLRSDIIWHKPNPMPESVTDRPTRAHEYIFLLTKSPRYYYDAEAIREPLARPPHAPGNRKLDASRNDQDRMDKVWGSPAGRNKRSVWTIPTQPFPEAHFATFPEKLPELCILAGSSPKACPKCRAPWKRVVEVESGQGEGKPYDRKRPDGLVFRGRNRPSKRIELGWQPTCTCKNNDGSGKCIVLDPFAGSGTTLAVAERLQRDAVGFELNPEYVKLIEKRLSGLQLQMVF